MGTWFDRAIEWLRALGCARAPEREAVLAWVKRVLHPPLPVAIPVIIVGFALVTVVLVRGLTKTLLAYASYGISFYACVVLVAALVRWIPVVYSRVVAWVERHDRLVRVRDDKVLRMRLGLDVTCAINAVYGAYMVFVGAAAGSSWYGSLGAYYLVVAVARVILTHTVRIGLGAQRHEMRALRACAVLILVLDVVLSSVAVQMIRDSRQVVYEGNLIYIAAIFTFYSMGMAVANMVRARGSDSLTVQAVRALGLCTALVSVLVLQTAMFASFDTGGSRSDLEVTMNAGTSLVVCATIATVGITMLRKGRALRQNLMEADASQSGPCAPYDGE